MALTYDDTGDLDAPAVVYLHGGGDSRLSRPAETHGVRVLGVDRCGVHDAGRTLRSFANEVAALAGRLGIDRFGVVGWSAGGPHALAVAAVAPERVERVALVASLPPPSGVRALPREVRLAMLVARRSPWLATRGLERWGRRPTPPTGEAGHDDAYRRGRVEGFRRGGRWLAHELAYLGRPWGFESAEVRVPVTLWWGTRDRVTPPSVADDYLRALPNARLRLVDGTHQVLFGRWAEILADAAPPARQGT
jgi:pimeloyl-ACP methyl ester carboxylesterase